MGVSNMRIRSNVKDHPPFGSHVQGPDSLVTMGEHFMETGLPNSDGASHTSTKQRHHRELHAADDSEGKTGHRKRSKYGLLPMWQYLVDFVRGESWDVREDLSSPSSGGGAVASGSGAIHDKEGASFRVVGIQIGHLGRTAQFYALTLGIFSFLLVYGFLQEYIVIHAVTVVVSVVMAWQIFNRKYGVFLTLCQFFGYSSFAMLHRFVHDDPPRRIPIVYYLVLGMLQASCQGLTNLSMRWLNYPAKLLFKSSRVIPTLLVGTFYMKKRYPMKDYVVVALLSVGLVTFMQADVRTSPSFHPMGIITICAALAMDAAVINMQEYTLRKYDASHDELVFYSYGLGSIVLLVSSLISGDFQGGIRFLNLNGATPVSLLVIFCSCGYLGVTCVTAMTKKFGALATSMTTTARKALTLFLSFFIFPKPATTLHMAGGFIFVVGLFIKTAPSSAFENLSRPPVNKELLEEEYLPTRRKVSGAQPPPSQPQALQTSDEDGWDVAVV